MVSKVKEAFKKEKIGVKAKKPMVKSNNKSDSKKSSKKVGKSISKTKVVPPTYKSMIIEGILVLKERNGSSRQALKKYILGKYPVGDTFDSRFNLAIRKGIDSGEFAQPKGPSGPVKVVKAKLAMKPDEEKVVAKKKVQTSHAKDEKLNGKSNIPKGAKAEEVEKKEPKKKISKKKDPSKSIKETHAAPSNKNAKKAAAKSANKDTKISNPKRAVKVGKK